MSESFDYVVVGGGSAGCVAAGQLAELGASVLVLEAGPAAEDHPETLSADGYKYAFINDQVFTERFTAPQPHAGNQRIFAGTGSVMGGSGSVNGMVYTRGAREDYAQWPRGWGWDDVAPDFAAIEKILRPRRRPPTRWTQACISAAVTCGFEHRDDLNDGSLSNAIGYEWMTYEGDRRRSSYVAFIKDQPTRPNLRVLPNTRVHRLVFDTDKRVVAVEYEHDGTLGRAAVRREVVMAAGALETPKLLMLSGVGPGQALRAAGIAQVHEATAMGQNLHDHPNVPLFFAATREIDCNYPQLYSFFRVREGSDLPAGQSDTCYVFWPARSAMKQAVQRVLPGQVLPHGVYSQLKHPLRRALGFAFDVPGVSRAVDHLYGIVVILGKPNSRGSVRLAGNDPKLSPIVDPAYFSDPGDLETMIDGIGMARRLAKSGGLAAWHGQEFMPGPWVRNREALGRWIARNAITTYHFAGTCKMGSGIDAVCDPRLRLLGVQGVRIADASAIPNTPVSALNAPSMLVGWRASAYARDERMVN